MLSYFAYHIGLKYFYQFCFLYILRTQLSTFVVKVTWWNTTKKRLRNCEWAPYRSFLPNVMSEQNDAKRKDKSLTKIGFFFLPFPLLRSSIRSKIDTRETQWGWSSCLDFYAPTISRRNVIFLENKASEIISWKRRRGIKNQIRLHKPWRFLAPLHWKERAG